MNTDEYQERYLAHQKRKKGVLIDIMRARHSDRMFDDKPVSQEHVQTLLDSAALAPSSCDRHAITPVPITSRDDKALLGGILVGGVGWIHRAPLILLLQADPTAYKAPGETTYMPFLDAGVAAQNILLTATALGLATTFCNPNIRPAHQDFYTATFGNYILTGAIATGHALPPGWIFETS